MLKRGKLPQAQRSGAGLVLSLARGFIELHGGSVDLKPEVNVCTKLVCSLPAHKPQSALLRKGDSA